MSAILADREQALEQLGSREIRSLESGHWGSYGNWIKGLNGESCADMLLHLITYPRTTSLESNKDSFTKRLGRGCGHGKESVCII